MYQNKTPLSQMLSARILNGFPRIPTSHILGPTFRSISLTPNANESAGAQMLVHPSAEGSTIPEMQEGVAEIQVGVAEAAQAAAEPVEAATSTRPTSTKRGKSKIPKDPVQNLCKILSSGPWSPRLQRNMWKTAPSVDHGVVMGVLDQAKTSKQALRFFRWAEWTGFKHDRSTYFKMLEILGRAKMIHIARSILMEMPSKGVQWNDDVFNSLIKTYGKEGIVQESVKLFTRMREFGVKHTVLAYNNFFSALIRNGRTAMAKRYYNKMLKQGLKPDMFTYNILIRGFCLKSKVGSARRFLNDMIAAGRVPTTVTYNTLLDGFCRAGKLEDALKVLNEMKEKDISPDVVTYTTLIKGYCKENRLDEAVGYFKEMVNKGVSPDEVTYVTLIPSLCEAARLNEAQRFLNEMMQQDMKPSASIFNSLINGQCKEGNMEGAVEVFDHMAKLGVALDYATYNTLVVSLYYRGKFDKSIEVLDDLLQKGVLPDQKSIASEFDAYSPMLKYFCGEGKTQKAEELFRKLLKRGSPDSSIFVNIILGHCKEGTPEAGFELFKIMMRKSLAVDVDTYNALIESFLQKEQPAEARNILDKMIESGHMPAASIFRAVIDGLFSDGRFQTASRVMRTMLEKDVKENVDLMPKILVVLLERGHMEEVFDRLNLMFEKNCVPDFNKILNGLCEKGKSSTAQKVLVYVLFKKCDISTETYDNVINALCNHGKADDAVYLLRAIARKGWSLDLSCYETLLSSLKAQGKTAKAEYVSKQFMCKSSADKVVKNTTNH